MTIEKVQKILKKSIKKLQSKKKIRSFDLSKVKVEHPNLKNHGDYSTNIAMIISGKSKKDPKEIAQLIKLEIKDSKPGFINKIEIIKPGFINFFVSKNAIVEDFSQTLNHKNFSVSHEPKEKKTIIVDYSSPNIAKPFNIGHLRSTIIGQSICNLYRFLGYNVIGDNHLGDWGTQFGKLIFAIKEWGDEEKIKKNPIKELNILYVKFHKEELLDSKLKEKGQEWFSKLENGDKEAKLIWKKCIDWSSKEFDQIYKILEVDFTSTLGESFYRLMTDDIIKEVMKKKVGKKSQGALIIDFSEKKLPPLMIQKTNKSSLYSTRDLATIKYRLAKFKPHKIIYEAGTDQKLYFKQLFRSAEILGWAKEDKFFHISHGLMRLKDGKMSTRKGKIILLENVLNEAIEKAEKIIESRSSNLSQDQRKKTARHIGIGAIKYNDLKQHYSRDIIFDWKKILNLSGNSGPYLQYSYARAYNILRKSKITNKELKFADKQLLYLTEKRELEILKLLSQFHEVVERSAYSYSPNYLCDFLFELCQRFNFFYQTYPILKEQEDDLRDARLLLTYGFCQILKGGLGILGIKALEKV